MALTKQQLEALNVSSFPNNNAGYITAEALRTFNSSSIAATVNQDSYTTDSASVDSRLDNLESFSSSLDATFATDAQLNASSSTLQSNINTKLDTASFNSYSSSVGSELTDLETFTASVSTSVGNLQTFSSSQYKADSSSFDVRITSIVTGAGLVTTASFNSYTASQTAVSAGFDGRLDSLEALIVNLPTTGSNSFTGSQIINGYLQSNTLFVTGSITASSYSGSVNGIGNVTLYSQSVDGRLDLVEVSASINSQSAWGAFQSASSFSASAVTSYARLAVANNFTANQTISGSARGRVSALSVSSNTASLDCSLSNFFTLLIPASSVTLINPSNVQPGQTVTIRLTQGSTTGSVRWPSNVKYNTAGAPFTGSAVGGAVDVVTFVTFDTTTLYLAGIKNLA